MLVGELNHRVKNSFGVIQALATQGDGVRSVEEYRHVLLGRMGSLARTHHLLFESHSQGAESRSLAGTLQPFAGERAKALQLDGAPVRLNSREALTVGLVLHELATNACEVRRTVRAGTSSSLVMADRGCRRRAAPAAALGRAWRSSRNSTAGRGLWNGTHPARVRIRVGWDGGPRFRT
jgi:hypothetical protein